MGLGIVDIDRRRSSSAPASARSPQSPPASWAAVIDWEEGVSKNGETEELYIDDMNNAELDSREGSSEVESRAGGEWVSGEVEMREGRGEGARKRRSVPSYLLPTAASTTSARSRVLGTNVTTHSKLAVGAAHSREAGASFIAGPKGKVKHKQFTHTRHQILADKRHWARVKNARSIAALESVASSRVASILRATDGVGHGGGGDTKGDYGGEGSKDFIYSATQFQQKLANKMPTFSTPGRSRIPYGPSNMQIKDGSSSLAIADAFLESQLGRELLASASQIGGGKEEDQGDISDADENYGPVRHFGNSSKLQHHMPLQRGESVDRDDDDDERDERDDSAVYFASGWKGTQGGWVADFGPPHTHPLSVQSFDHPNDRKTGR